MDSDLKRDDVARKSFRIPANKISKRLAPMPPPRQESITKMTPADKISFDNRIKQVNLHNKINLNMNYKNDQIQPTINAFPLTQQHKKPIPTKPGDIKLCITDDDDDDDANQKDNNDTTIQSSQISSIDVLKELGKQIFDMENDSINSEQQKNSEIISEKNLLHISNRYGNHENLLNTGISNVASDDNSGLCCETPNSNNPKIIDFNRDNAYRKSTGGGGGDTLYLTTKLLQKSTKPISRTASDTKKVENSVKMLRIGGGVKKHDELNNDEKMPSSLNRKKKEDNIIIEQDNNKLLYNVEIKQRQIIDGKFRPTIISQQRSNQQKISKIIEKVLVIIIVEQWNFRDFINSCIDKFDIINPFITA